MSFWVVEYKCKNNHKWLEQGGVQGTMILGRSKEQGYGECPECLQEGELTGNHNPLGIDNSDIKFYITEDAPVDESAINPSKGSTYTMTTNVTIDSGSKKRKRSRNV